MLAAASVALSRSSRLRRRSCGSSAGVAVATKKAGVASGGGAAAAIAATARTGLPPPPSLLSHHPFSSGRGEDATTTPATEEGADDEASVAAPVAASFEEVDDDDDDDADFVRFPPGTAVTYVSGGPFPEPDASAAGVRTARLLERLATSSSGVVSVRYAAAAAAAAASSSAASETAETGKKKKVGRRDPATREGEELLRRHGIEVSFLPPNRSGAARDFLLGGRDGGGRDGDDDDDQCGDGSGNDDDNRDDGNKKKKKSRNRNELVIFDRFYTEEMHSFRWNRGGGGGDNDESSSNSNDGAVLVLDMQDMHSLRWHRQKEVVAVAAAAAVVVAAEAAAANASDGEQQKAHSEEEDEKMLTFGSLKSSAPSLRDPRLLRELASIYRCDLTLVCSAAEMDLLVNRYGVPPSKLCLAPMFDAPASSDSAASASWGGPSSRDGGGGWRHRSDFVFVGGFRHDPNVDAVRLLAERLWPRIRSRLVDMEAPASAESDPPALHVYGAYCPDALRRRLHDPPGGFYVHGYHPDLGEILGDKRVMLAPLRFGAGIKGKVIDAWRHGVPVVTTPVGSEGLLGSFSGDGASSTTGEPGDGDAGDDKYHDEWGGYVVEKEDDFVDAAVRLYSDAGAWERAVGRIDPLLDGIRSESSWGRVGRRLVQALEEREVNRRKGDVLRAVIWHQSNRSTEYFSKYLEVKAELKKVKYELAEKKRTG